MDWDYLFWEVVLIAALMMAGYDIGWRRAYKDMLELVERYESVYSKIEGHIKYINSMCSQFDRRLKALEDDDEFN